MTEPKRPTRSTAEEIADREKTLQRQKMEREQLIKDRKMLLKMPGFQRVMADILSRGGMFRTCMTGNSMTYHLSGRQDFTREIWNDFLQVDQTLAFDLLKPKIGEIFDD